MSLVPRLAARAQLPVSLVSFSKADDPDTRQVALTDLETLVRALDEKTLPVFLKVFSDVHLERRKPAGKAALMRFVGTAITLQPELLAPLLKRLTKLCIKRLADADGHVRDDAAASLASCVLQACTNGGPETLATVLPGLLHTLGATFAESSRAACGSAVALGELVRVLGPSCHPETFLPVWGYLKPALEQPDHMAKPFVMKCVAALVTTLGVHLRPILAEVLACLLTELQNSEWVMRKAALETVVVHIPLVAWW